MIAVRTASAAAGTAAPAAHASAAAPPGSSTPAAAAVAPTTSWPSVPQPTQQQQQQQQQQVAAPASPAAAPQTPSAATTLASPRACSSPVAAPSSYSASSYWDTRYATQRGPQRGSFDWFFTYAALRPLLQSALPLPALPALHVGCGNSDLSVGLGEDGTPVINTDISPVVIQQMLDDAAQWPDGPARRNCSWAVADCRSMPQYEDTTFGSVVDKGTLDAVLCSGTGLGDARSYVSEAHRLLAPGGVFLVVSLGQPEARLSVLRAQRRQRRPSSADAAMAPPGAWAALHAAAAAAVAAGPPPAATAESPTLAAAAASALAAAAAATGPPSAGRREVRWSHVHVYLLPKPSLYLAGEAALLGRRSTAAAAPAGDGTPRRSISKEEPVAWLGPYEVGPDLEAALSAPGLDPRDFFYAYACYKSASQPAPRSRRASALMTAWPAAAAAAAAAAASGGGSGGSFTGGGFPPIELPAGAVAAAAAAAAASAFAGDASLAATQPPSRTVASPSSVGGLKRFGSGGGMGRSASYDGPGDVDRAPSGDPPQVLHLP